MTNLSSSIKQIRLFLALASLFIFINQALADGNTLKPVSSHSTRKILSRLVEGVERFTLSNGMRVVLYRRPNAPVFEGQIWVKVGGVNEQPGITGAVHMLEHMAFKGSDTIGTKNYAKEKKLIEEYDVLFEKIKAASDSEEQLEKAKKRFKDIGEQLEKLWVNNEFSRIYQDRGAAGLNAATGKDYTYYKVSLPNVAFDLWAWMESDRLLNPVFRQFYKEVQVVMEERRWRTDDSPGGKLYEALLATAFWMHPNRLPVIGWKSDLQGFGRKDIAEIFRKYYRPENMVISLVGDLDSAQVRKTLEKYFSRLPKGKGPLPKINTVEAEQNGTREAIVRFDAQPRFAMAYHKPVYPHEDDMRFTLLHSLLGEGRSSIFYRELVEGKQLVTKLNTSEAPGEIYPSLFYVWGMPKQGVSNERIIKEVGLILDRLKKAPLPEADLAAAKKRLRVDLLTSLSSNAGLARMLGRLELLYGNWEVVNEMYDVTFRTTTAELQELAKTYFTDKNRTIVRLEKPAK